MNVKETSKISTSLVLDLEYPNELFKAIATDKELPYISFVDLLANTMTLAVKNRLWCDQLKDYTPVVLVRNPKKFPESLLINCAHENRGAYMPLWRQQVAENPDEAFLPTRVKINRNDSNKIIRLDLAREDSSVSDDEWVVYELDAVISHIHTSDHLVAHIRIPESYTESQIVINSVDSNKEQVNKDDANYIRAFRRRSSTFVGNPVKGGDWVLFNDFAVSPSSIEQAVDFRHPFRNPCVLRYRRIHQEEEDRNKIFDSTTCPITSEVFSSPSLALAQGPKTFVSLPLDKLPKNGDLVAIDCEFVALSTEEFKVLADGTRVVTAPPRLSLARVSCLSGDGTVFIDDYIVTPENVEDHLTRFSGLVPGDLDPKSSKHHLIPLRIAYMKLRHLVDRGCIFVGHGLNKDFRVINIFVPPENILDTVELFYLGHRKLSLAFLASYLLEEKIQGRIHDSIEDARTALKLYQKYETFRDQGILQEKLHEIFEQGQRRNYK
uniref:USP domain-containing protein n=1 Tax=Aplanochytrium stocchinoi TaxID=215587 RepID=A0A7S3LR56_9STRA